MIDVLLLLARPTRAHHPMGAAIKAAELLRLLPMCFGPGHKPSVPQPTADVPSPTTRGVSCPSSPMRAMQIPHVVRRVLALAPLFGVALVVGSQPGSAQISGSVVNSETLQPVSAAQVFIPALDLGVLTGADGRYQLVGVPPGTHTVTVQSIGFQIISQDVTVAAGQAAVANFDLSAEALALDAIVVTGTAGGTQRRAIGNVVEQIEMAEVLQERPITNIEQVLSSATPGMSIVGDPGTVGGGAQIRLRGSSSATLAGDPIVYIDGVRMNAERGEVGRHTAISSLQDISPNDIASIEVIKGPAASTLYGTEAANGVIQIITRRGVAGEPQFDAVLEYGANWLPSKYISDLWAPMPDNRRDLVRVNYYELEKQRGNQVLNLAPHQRYSIAVRGGTDLIRYSASLNRTDQDGVTRWNWDTRNSARASLSLTASEDLSIDLNTSYSQGQNAPTGDSFFGSNFGWGGQAAHAVQPHLFPGRGFSSRPEFLELDSQRNTVDTRRSTLSLELRHLTTGWLTHRIVAGLDNFNQQRQNLVYLDPGSDLSAAREGRKTVATTYAPVKTLDLSGTANLNVTPQLSSATSYGLQYYNRQNHLHTSEGEGFATRPLTTVGAAARTEANETFVENTTVGVYLQEQIGWEDRIFITGAIRADDNSAFGENFDAAIYPKLSATWVVHEEGFWADRVSSDLISQLRLRGAWGAAGQQPDAFAATTLFQPVTGPEGQPALTPRTYGNPDLGPERGEELELGFDAEFLNGRMDMTFTSFWRKTKDALVARPLGPSLGYTAQTLGSTQLVNVGQISAWGTETALNVQLMTQNPVTWDMSLAFTTLGNRVDDLGGVGRIPLQRGRSMMEGYPLASIIEYRVVSAEFVEGNFGPVTNTMCDGGTGPDGRVRGGAPIPCEDADRVFWGVGEPTRLASLQSSWTLFQNWQLSMMVDYKGGDNFWMSSDYLGARQAGFESSHNVFLQDNPIGVGYMQYSRNGFTYNRAGFAKLRELSLAYTLPLGLVNRFGASRARINIGARNLATLWMAQSHVERSTVIDPEMSRPDENFGGESGGGFPPLSSLVANVSVSF
ncbi:MAG: TonB-dependent receptor plug domain-containing protein [Gemmatimonas sp.]|nr:TonB-dependent receptor plug domain-containing protein [Gemmatimonas sp.]